MATTVEARSQKQATQAPAPTPWYRDRNRLAMAAAVAVILIAVLGWFMMTSNRRKEEFAQRSLNQARTAAEAGNLPLASSELQRVIDTYRGTDAATEAVLTLNQVRMVNGQGELAAVGLRDFLASGPDEKYLAPANGLLGAALENGKRFADAAVAYEEASRTATLDYLRARYLIDAGRAYRAAGQDQKAATAYRAVIQKYPESSSFTEAQVRLAELTGGKM